MSDRAMLPADVEPRNDWRTPPEFFALCGRIWGPFGLDAASDHENALTPTYLVGPHDPNCCVDCGLCAPWDAFADVRDGGRVWCNPPYGRGVERWARKAYVEASEHGVTSVLLLPASTDALWFYREVVAHADEVRLLVGRIQFVSPPGRVAKQGDANRYANALAVFRPNPARPASVRFWDWRAELRRLNG